ncbi:MAG: isopentenyl phosphate kinase family protein [Candidatus Aenigmarchaeota archaeon]|nr:isopentenyl phosphate kinase family protein [Candidatus Aenigmarchaeota archaeon]
MQKLCLIKLGGSVLTDTTKPNTPKIEEIMRLAREIRSTSRVILGHGSGSFGHVTAHKYKVQDGLKNANSMKGAAMTQNVAAKLHRIVVDELVKAGVSAFSFPPSAGAIARNGRIVRWDISALEEALDKGFLPVTCGDVVVDLTKGVTIASTEEVFRHIAQKLRPARIIVGGDTDGVFTANPKVHKNAKLIERIDGSNIANALRSAGASLKVDVTGGMRSKVAYLYDMSRKFGVECRIINATVPGRVRDALAGRRVRGTIIRA